MEKNLINNKNIKIKYLDIAMGYLMKSNQINKDDLKGVNADYGYIFLTEAQNVEALFKIKIFNKAYYFAVQKGKLMQLNMVEEMYKGVIENMKNMHECLKNNTPNETVKEKERKEKNNNKLIEDGIQPNNNLICWFNEENKPHLKSVNEICERAILSIILASYATDIHSKADKQILRNTYLPIFNKFNDTMKKMNKKEEKLFTKFTEQDLIDLDWEFEAGWSLLWVLGLINDDITKTNTLCDCQRALNIITSCSSIEELIKKSSIRSIDEILDMHDLFYRYHWAINNQKINNSNKNNNLNSSCVFERRRGLEWVLSEENDWYKLDLNT